MAVSEVTRAKISASKKGHKTSPETRAKISAALSGRKQPPELVEKRSGERRKWTEEQKQTLRERLKSLPKRTRVASHVAWNKGLSKETSESVRRQADSLRKSFKEGRKTWSEGLNKATSVQVAEASRKISETLMRKVEEGTWHNSFSRARTHEYNGHKFHGTWELLFAQFLDKGGKAWERPRSRFPYEFEGRGRRYTPDFYLPEEDLYLEIKGYPTEKDLAKWMAFAKPLLIMFGEQLHALGVISAFREDIKFDFSVLPSLGFIKTEKGWLNPSSRLFFECSRLAQLVRASDCQDGSFGP